MPMSSTLLSTLVLSRQKCCPYSYRSPIDAIKSCMFCLNFSMHMFVSKVYSLRGDFLQNRMLGAQNQSDARMRN